VALAHRTRKRLSRAADNNAVTIKLPLFSRCERMLGYRLASCYATSVFASCARANCISNKVFERQNQDIAKNIEKFMSTTCRNLWLISKTKLEFAYRACAFLIKRKKKDAEEHQ